MDIEHIEFRAGRDVGGFRQWVAATIIEQEQRSDGIWAKVLPAHADSEEDAQWVPLSDVRQPRAQRS